MIDYPRYQLKLLILAKMVRKRVWGKYHIDEDDIPKGKHLGKPNRKMVKKAIDDLVREGLIIRFPHHGKKRVYLNRHRINEINRLIEKIDF